MYNRYGFFVRRSGPVYYDNIRDWNGWQLNFLKEYSTRYETYVEKSFSKPQEYRKRANRTLAYLPVLIPEKEGGSSFGVIKDISSSGYLLASQRSFEADEEITVATVLGADTVSIKGRIARVLSNDSDDYPLFLAGVKLSGAQSKEVDRIINIAEKAENLIKL